MGQSKWGRWSDISQVVSAAAVVASLLYVGVEIRQNTEAARSATRQAISDTDLEFIGASLDPLTLLQAQSKEELGLELNDVEMLALLTHQHINFRIFENAFYQHYESELLDDERWKTYRWIISLLFATKPSVDSMWTAYGPAFDSAFQDTVAVIRVEPFAPRVTGRAP